MNTGDHTHMLGSVTQFLDAADMRQFFELRDARQLDRTKARSTVAFDLTFAIVTLLSVVGLWLDIWHRSVDESDTPRTLCWHCALCLRSNTRASGASASR